MTTPTGRPSSALPAPSTPAGSPAASGVEGAWQDALAAEHRAVFGYGLIGPRLGESDRGLARECSAAHEQERDSISAAMASAGVTPVPADADYPALYPVPDAAAARRVAVDLENVCAAGWRYLYAQCVTSTSSRARTLRVESQRQLTASAVRGTTWRARIDPAKSTTAFPGID